MSKQTQVQRAYGQYPALINIANEPKISRRNPTAADRAELGQIWINKLTNEVYILTSVGTVAGGNPGAAVWTRMDNGSGATGIAWITTGAAAVNMAVNSGYYLTNVGAVTLTLPAASVLGDEIWITTEDASALLAGIIITQGAAQTIRNAGEVSTAGGGAKFSIINNFQKAIDVHLICTVANTQWDVVSANAPINLV